MGLRLDTGPGLPVGQVGLGILKDVGRWRVGCDKNREGHTDQVVTCLGRTGL